MKTTKVWLFLAEAYFTEGSEAAMWLCLFKHQELLQELEERKQRLVRQQQRLGRAPGHKAR